jgi:hypothetical protein
MNDDSPEHTRTTASQDDDETAQSRWSGGLLDQLVERQIRAAEAAGQFRNLPGQGKPLELSDDSLIPDSLRAGMHLLKNAGYTPTWIDLQQRIRTEQDQLAQWQASCRERWQQSSEAERDRLLADLEQRLTTINREIRAYNLQTPAVVGQLPLLQLWRERQKLTS